LAIGPEVIRFVQQKTEARFATFEADIRSVILIKENIEAAS
jgi:hypothetical protein